MMDFAEFRELVQNPAEIVPADLLADLVAPPATDEEIAHAERKINAKLPADYVMLLQEFGGGVLFCGDQAKEIYSVHRQHDSYILRQQPPRDWVQNFVAVADNGCGDCYGFVVENGICLPRLMLCDHEIGFAVTPTRWPNILRFLAETD